MKFDENIYSEKTYTDVTEFIVDLVTDGMPTHGKYIDVPAVFKIETTSFPEKEMAVMYHWQIAINGRVLTGRTWDQYCDFVSFFQDVFPDEVLTVYVHNLNLTYAFLKHWFEFGSTFKVRSQILYAWQNTFVYRCSKLLTGRNLEESVKLVRNYPFNKLGYIDEKLARLPVTPCYVPLNSKPLSCLIQEKIIEYGHIDNIPLTLTSETKAYCRSEVLDTEYRKLMSQLTIDYDEYNMLRDAFIGGLCVANEAITDCVINNVHSYDLCSAYPAEYIYNNRMPMSKGVWVEASTQEDLDNIFETMLGIVTVRLKDVEATTSLYIIPFNKCKFKGESFCEQDKVVYADCVEITMTSVDYELYKKCYSWSELTVKNMRVLTYLPGKIPTSLRNCFANLYEDKKEAKKSGDEIDIKIAKIRLNSIFGMCCEDPTHGSFDENLIDKYNTNKGRFTFYPWSVFCTAYVRKHIVDAVVDELQEDFVYCDTDCVKFLGDHDEYFKAYNDSLVDELGSFEYEGTYSRFLALGPKTYVSEMDEEVTVTASGLPKIGREYIACDPWKLGKDSLEIPAEFSGKLIHHAFDTPRTATLTDYLGYEETVTEMSGIWCKEGSFTIGGVTEGIYSLLDCLEVVYN